MSNYSEKAKTVHDFIQTMTDKSPKIGKGFQTMHHTLTENKALSPGQKELIALGISIAIRCEGCIACHVKAALQTGATREEMIETIGVAVVMGGGPSLVYGEKAYEAMMEMDEQT